MCSTTEKLIIFEKYHKYFNIEKNDESRIEIYYNCKMVDDTRQFGEFEIMNSIITLRKRELKES